MFDGVSRHLKVNQGTFDHQLTNLRARGWSVMWAAGETTKLIDSGEVGWPKRSTTCQLRLLGRSVLNDVCMTSDGDATALRVVVLAGRPGCPC